MWFNPIQDGPFRGCSQMEGEGDKKTHINPTIIKLGTVIPCPKKIKKVKKIINLVPQPLLSADIGIYSPEIANFAISRTTDIDCILIHNF